MLEVKLCFSHVPPKHLSEIFVRFLVDFREKKDEKTFSACLSKCFNGTFDKIPPEKLTKKEEIVRAVARVFHAEKSRQDFSAGYTRISLRNS